MTNHLPGGIGLDLPPEYRRWIEGDILPINESFRRLLASILNDFPQCLLNAARINYLFVAKNLKLDGRSHEGIAYANADTSARWIGLNADLFEGSKKEDHLGVSLLEACLLEEVVHCWDFFLETQEHRFCSHPVFGAEWAKVALDALMSPTPFNIPNRKQHQNLADQSAEDWASAVVWYHWRRKSLRAICKDRHDFVERLFCLFDTSL